MTWDVEMLKIECDCSGETDCGPTDMLGLYQYIELEG